MQRLISLVSRFGRDERGAFAVIFGLMAIVLVALGGAVVDYVVLEQARSRSQLALDAAALALQQEIYKTPINIPDITTKAQNILIERAGGEFGVSAKVTSVQADVDLGSLTIDAEFSLPTMFVSLVGVQQMSASLRSQATQRMLDVEVVMVLDNSGSMGGTPMSNLKKAACNAANILFYDKTGNGCALPTGTLTANPNIFIGVVPFTSLVNIGKSHINEPWLDWTGRSSISRLNFDDDDDETTPFLGNVNRRDLFAATKTSWSGCVEARLAPYDTTDDAPNTDERLFVPLFTPDTRDSRSFSYLSDTGGTCQPKTCTQRVQRSCSGNKTNCNGTQSYTYTLTKAGVSTAVATSCIPAGASTPSGTTTYPNNSTQVITRVYDIPLTDKERQERMCKYNATTAVSNVNLNCPAVALLPLTAVPKSVLDGIDAMVADGNTNIQQGAVWGMHALTSGQPLTQGKTEEPGRVAKVMILMTDGDNQPQMVSDANGSAYFSWGFMYDGRLGPRANINSTAKLRAEMDNRTKAVCAYAKAQRGIEIYTIGLNVSSTNKAMLTECASGPGYYFFPATPDLLNDTFRRIAEKLAPLRISQ